MSSNASLRASEAALSDLNQAVRDTINDTARIKSRLMVDRVAWYRLCSAMDAIADTDMALHAYLASRGEFRSIGHSNLSFYGAMQALVVQQDAVRVLSEGAGVPYPPDDKLTEFRRYRNLSVGHPTRPTQHAPAVAAFVIQNSLRTDTPEMLVVNKDGSTQTEEIDVAAIVDEQTRILAVRLTAVLEHLRSQDMAHRKLHSHVKIADTLSLAKYAAQKTCEELHRLDESGSPEGFNSHLVLIENGLKKFTSVMSDRGDLEAHADTLLDRLKYGDHLVRRIRELANARNLMQEDQWFDAQAFSNELRSTIDGLHDFAEQKDAEYGASAK